MNNSDTAEDVTPAPAPDSLGETTPSAGDWRTVLPDDLRQHPAFDQFEDAAALAREHVHLQRLIGRKGVLPPGPDAGPEDYERFYDELGRPASPDDYDLADVTRPEDLPWNEEAEAQMLARMHAAGLTNAQARELLSAYGEVQGGAWQAVQKSQARALETATETLQSEWGDAFDSNLALANRVFATAFGESVDAARQLRLADGSYLGDNPMLVRAFAALGGMTAEPDFVGAKETRLTQSAGEAHAELQRLEADSEFRGALLNRAHPDHKASVARRSQLSKLAYNGD